MTFDVRDRESNNHTSDSTNQIPPRPEHSASIHRHPKLMCGLQKRLSRIKWQLLSDHANGLMRLEKVLAPLQDSGQEPFPGFIDNMTAEFASIREELGGLDPKQPSNAPQFVAIAKRIVFLLRTLSLVIGCWAPKTGPSASAAISSDSDTNP